MRTVRRVRVSGSAGVGGAAERRWWEFVPTVAALLAAGTGVIYTAGCLTVVADWLTRVDVPSCAGRLGMTPDLGLKATVNLSSAYWLLRCGVALLILVAASSVDIGKNGKPSAGGLMARWSGVNWAAAWIPLLAGVIVLRASASSSVTGRWGANAGQAEDFFYWLAIDLMTVGGIVAVLSGLGQMTAGRSRDMRTWAMVLLGVAWLVVVIPVVEGADLGKNGPMTRADVIVEYPAYGATASPLRVLRGAEIVLSTSTQLVVRHRTPAGCPITLLPRDRVVQVTLVNNDASMAQAADERSVSLRSHGWGVIFALLFGIAVAVTSSSGAIASRPPC